MDWGPRKPLGATEEAEVEEGRHAGVLPGGAAVLTFQSDNFYARSFGFSPWVFLSLLEFLPEAAWASSEPLLTELEPISLSGLAAAHSKEVPLIQCLLECGEWKRAVSCHQAAKCFLPLHRFLAEGVCVQTHTCRETVLRAGSLGQWLTDGACSVLRQVPRHRWAFYPDI